MTKFIIEFWKVIYIGTSKTSGELTALHHSPLLHPNLTFWIRCWRIRFLYMFLKRRTLATWKSRKCVSVGTGSLQILKCLGPTKTLKRPCGQLDIIILLEVYKPLRREGREPHLYLRRNTHMYRGNGAFALYHNLGLGMTKFTSSKMLIGALPVLKPLFLRPYIYIYIIYTYSSQLNASCHSSLSSL